MDNILINDISELNYEEQRKIFNDYIDFAFYHFQKNMELVKMNLDAVHEGRENAIIFGFEPVIHKKVLSKKVFVEIVKEMFRTTVSDVECYIILTLAEYDNKRFYQEEEIIPVGVKNEFGDIVYYNKNRLKYLETKMGPVKDKNIKKEIKKEKNISLSIREIFIRNGFQPQINDTRADHIAYKYYVDLYKKENNIEKRYDAWKKNHTNHHGECMSEIEFIEYSIDEEMKKEVKTRKRS